MLKKNHHTLKSAVVKHTLLNVFIQPLMPSTRLPANQKHRLNIVPLAMAVKKISSTRFVSAVLPVAAMGVKPEYSAENAGASR